MNRQKFTKYEKMGAYHWHETDQYDFRRHNPVTAARYDLVSEEIPKLGATVLDVGCGDGTLTARLAGVGNQVVGVDYSGYGIKLAWEQVSSRDQKKGIHFLRGSVFTLPFPSESFDYVVCADVIEHVEDPRTALSEIKRVLKPMGRSIISTPQHIQGHVWDECHLTEYSAEEFRQLLGAFFSRIVMKGSQIHLFYRLYFRLRASHRFIKWAMNLLSLFIYNPLRIQTVNVRPYHGQLIAICQKAGGSSDVD